MFNYNMHQIRLHMATYYEPEESHPAQYINSRKWKSDDTKVMNWDYYEKDDYYIDPKNVRFNFLRYSRQSDKNGFIRSFKIYKAEKYDLNNNIILAALTKSGQLRRVTINPEWEYYKNKIKNELSNPSNAAW